MIEWIGILQVVVPVALTVLGGWIALSGRIAKLEQRIVATERDVNRLANVLERLDNSVNELNRNVAKLEGKLDNR